MLKKYIVFIALTATNSSCSTPTVVSRPSPILLPDGVHFAPLDPSLPGGMQIAVLQGNPQSGPSAFLAKFPKGFNSGAHKHSANYHAVVLTGQHTHWFGEQDHNTKALGPTGYWFQSAGEWHGDICSTDECVVFIYVEDTLDFIPISN